MEIEQVEFRQELVGALMVEGYDEPWATFIAEAVCRGYIDPFGGKLYPTTLKALESLGVFDNPTLRARIEG